MKNPDFEPGYQFSGPVGFRAPAQPAARQYIRHPNQPETLGIWIEDGVFVKAHSFADAGMVIPQHEHKFSHLSFVASGAVAVEADGALLGVFQAPAGIPIRAGVAHMFTTLQPQTVVLCLHNADRLDADGEPPHEEHRIEFVGEG